MLSTDQAIPISFEAVPMERVWGGRLFKTLLGKQLPENVLIGELWEIVDRPETQSVVQRGIFAGKTLHTLWSQHREEVFGKLHVGNPSRRFPLLIKLLDARERLSVQVHPPISCAEKLGGEPKTECWYFLQALEGSVIYAGLKRGVTRETFEEALRQGTVEKTLHVASAKSGNSIFIPSGRLHAIGEGLLIVEIQQNSDTTYRVFDWNRNGLDGKPRELQVDASLASIDFDDFEPMPTCGDELIVADCPYFRVEKHLLPSAMDIGKQDDFSVVTCLSGGVKCGTLSLKPGEFALIPASSLRAELIPEVPSTSILITRLPA